MDDTLLHALIPLYPLQVPVAGGDGGLDATFLIACLFFCSSQQVPLLGGEGVSTACCMMIFVLLLHALILSPTRSQR